MFLRTTAAWIMPLIFGLPGAAATKSIEQPSRFYSGAEWVLDANGNILGSSAIVVERVLDVPHRSLGIHIRRATPNPAGSLPAASSDELTLVGTSAAPYGLEGLGGGEGGSSTHHIEELKGNVLVSRDVVRDEQRRVIEVRVINATPLTEEEFAAWSCSMTATRPH